jgi:hypothetical protein
MKQFPTVSGNLIIVAFNETETAVQKWLNRYSSPFESPKWTFCGLVLEIRDSFLTYDFLFELQKA